MNEAAIYGRLTEIFQDLFGGHIVSLHPDVTAKDVAGWDSIKHVSLIVAVEHTFGIEVTSSEMDHLTNVGDLARLISEKRA